MYRYIKCGVFIPQGFHIISYALAIYLLSLFIAAISPKVDPAFAEIFGRSSLLTLTVSRRNPNSTENRERRIPTFYTPAAGGEILVSRL